MAKASSSAQKNKNVHRSGKGGITRAGVDLKIKKVYGTFYNELRKMQKNNKMLYKAQLVTLAQLEEKGVVAAETIRADMVFTDLSEKRVTPPSSPVKEGREEEEEEDDDEEEE